MMMLHPSLHDIILGEQLCDVLEHASDASGTERVAIVVTVSMGVAKPG
jgi:hypothetical protein